MSGMIKAVLSSQGEDASSADPKLSPKLERARRKVLSGLGAVSLSEALAELKEDLASQKTEDSRLANLSAQSWILRRKLESLRSGSLQSSVQDLMGASPGNTPKAKLMRLSPSSDVSERLDKSLDVVSVENQQNEAEKSWRKVRILAEAEVNGMVFFEGSVLAVKPEDAVRLVDAGRAEIIEYIGEDSAQKSTDTKPAKGKRVQKSGE